MLAQSLDDDLRVVEPLKAGAQDLPAPEFGD